MNARHKKKRGAFINKGYLLWRQTMIPGFRMTRRQRYLFVCYVSDNMLHGMKFGIVAHRKLFGYK